MAHDSKVASDPKKPILSENDLIDAGMSEQSPADRDLAQRNYNRYYYAYSRGHREYVDSADVCDQFYRGEQWDTKDRKALEKEGRPAMTVNMILSAINSVKGEYSNKRADFKFKPKRDGATTQQATVLNKVIMHECDDADYDDQEGDMFMDGLITDRGYLDIRMSTENNPGGEIEIELRDPRSVIPDPDASNYDPKKWRDVITTEFISLEDIAMRYGEKKAREVRMNIDTFGRFSTDTVDYFEDTTFGDDIGQEVGASGGFFYGDGETPEEHRLIKSVRIIDRQYWQVGEFKHFFNAVANDSTPVPLTWDEEKIMMHAQQFGLEVITKRQKRVRWTVSADKTMLHDDWSPYSNFTIIPYFPYFRRGHPIGMVKNLLNPQEILNKTTSQTLHVVNTTANSGWIVGAGALSNMTADDLAATGSKTGLVIETAPGRSAEIQKIQPNQMPSGLDGIGVRAAQSIYEISGVNRSMMGTDGQSTAGIAIQERKQSGLVQLQPVFDNLARTRRMVGRKLLELVQTFYTDERVFMIADYTQPHADLEEVPVNQQVPNETGGFSIVNDLSLGKYGMFIGSMPAKDVYSEVQFAEALSLREAGIAVPDYRIISYSNLDQKEEMAEESKQMQGLAAPTEEEMQMQQMQQEVQMQMIQIDLEDKIATVGLKDAQADLAQAKAMEAADKPGLEREKLELEATITSIEQATRERVNRLKELSGQMSSMANNRAKLEIEKRKILGNMATTAMASKTKPTKTTEKK